jgi:hypothetical protein
MKRNFVLLAAVVGMSLPAACARRVVLDPEAALAKNSADWTIKSEPRPVVEESPPPKPIPAPAAVPAKVKIKKSAVKKPAKAQKTH